MSGELTFDATQDTLETLLRQMQQGKIQLPEFQRGWVWDDDHIVDLLVSVSRSFPVGAIMTLVSGGEVRFKTRGVEGVSTGVPLPTPDRLLLDGQQRLTSLYQALLLGEPVETRDAQRRAVKRWYYASITDALGDGDARQRAVLSIPADRRVTSDFGRKVEVDLSSQESEVANGMFPLSKIFDSDDWMMAWFSYWNYDKDKIDAFNRFKNQFIGAFRGYQIPIIQLRKEATKEAVCLIFEKVNSGGVPLTAFELLTATYAADGFDLREDWLGEHGGKGTNPGRFQRMTAKRPLLRAIQNTEYLQAVSLAYTLQRKRAAIALGTELKKLPPVSCTRQAILDLPREAYAANADAAEEGFLRAAQFLWGERIFRPEDIPYRSQLVPLAVIVHVLGPRWQDAEVRLRLRQWFWCGVFGELYGSATETRFARDVQEVVDWIEDGAMLPATVSDCNFAADRLLTLRSRLSAAYKGLHALLMQRGGARDLRTGATMDEQTFFDEPVDIHHVFPKAWCEGKGISWTVYDSIVNKTPLSSSTNRMLGGDAPSIYLKRFVTRHWSDEVEIDNVLNSHFIEASLIKADDFHSFVVARAERLLKLVSEATGRPTGGRSIREIFAIQGGIGEIEEPPEEAA